MKKITFVAFLMLLSVIAFAQRPVRFGIYVNGISPMGDLGAGNEIKKNDVNPLSNYALWWEDGNQGYADMGGGIGFDVTLPIAKGIGVFAGADMFYNTNKSDLKDYFEEVSKDFVATPGINSYSYTMSNFVNIPMFIGVSYILNYENNFTLFAEAATGPNFRLISDYKSVTKYDNGEESKETIDYNTATTFGFKFGAGVLMWNRMTVVLDYYSLGSAKITGTESVKAGNTTIDTKFEGKKDVYSAELVLRVGYHF